MAQTLRGGKTAAVSEYLDAHPGAGPKEIVAALAKQHIKITRAHVSNIKGKLNKGSHVVKAAKPAAATETPAPVAKAATNGGTITLEQIKKVAATVKAMGGFPRMVEVLDVIKEAGGVKKFKDLAEAMSCPATDDIPF